MTFVSIHALPSNLFSLLPMKGDIRVHSCPFVVLPSMDARRFCRAGALKRANHALPSSPFSLIPTPEAHCKVTTHYPLLPSPYSLLWKPTAK